MTGNDYMICVRLGHSGGDSAHTGLRNKLNADTRDRINTPQIVDELVKVLNGVNIVVGRKAISSQHQVWRRRRRAIVSSTLCPGSLPSFAGLGTLGDLDLQLIRVDQIVGGHTESPRSDLLDGGAAKVTVEIHARPCHILAALARV